MNRRQLEQDLQDLFEGRLGPDRFAALQHELKADPEAQESYLDYAELHNALQLRAEGIDLMRVIPMEQVIARRQRVLLRNSVMAAAAVLMIGAAVMSFVLTRPPEPAVRFATAPGTEFGLSHELSGDDAPKGWVLQPSSRLEVRSGTVELEFSSGVRGIVRGPADLTLQRDDLLSLANGTVWFHVPQKAVGFKVDTPDLTLTDLGTEFGVISDTNFLDEVHVFTGKVEVLHRRGLKTKASLEAGQARYAGADGRWREIPPRRDLFLDELPTALVEPEVVATEEFATTQFIYAEDVSDSDLLQGLTPATTGWNTSGNSSPLELTDGIHGAGFQEVPGDQVQGAWTTVGATAEYKLGRGSHGLGFDITSIQSIADWDSAGFGNQAWTVEVKPVGGSYEILHTVRYHPLETSWIDGGGATKVTLKGNNGVLASGIESIRFTASHVAGSVGNAFVWREVDVFGEPTSR